MSKPAWLTKALGEVGTVEQPVNRTKYGRRYNLDGQPWCAMFVSWCLARSGHPLPVMQAGLRDGFAAAVAGMDYAKKHGAWRPSWEAEPGDLIIYGWDGPGSSWERMHVGMVIASGPKGSTGRSVEGNRGDCVARHTFIVGAAVVLGTIDVKKLLGVAAEPTPLPQPRNPEHPEHTGPPDDGDGNSYTVRADLTGVPARVQARFVKAAARVHVVIEPTRAPDPRRSSWWRRMRRWMRSH